MLSSLFDIPTVRLLARLAFTNWSIVGAGKSIYPANVHEYLDDHKVDEQVGRIVLHQATCRHSPGYVD